MFSITMRKSWFIISQFQRISILNQAATRHISQYGQSRAVEDIHDMLIKVEIQAIDNANRLHKFEQNQMTMHAKVPLNKSMYHSLQIRFIYAKEIA